MKVKRNLFLLASSSHPWRVLPDSCPRLKLAPPSQHATTISPVRSKRPVHSGSRSIERPAEQGTRLLQTLQARCDLPAAQLAAHARKAHLSDQSTHVANLYPVLEQTS
eukprot:682232-Hanusia_phi.AAC.3